MRGCVSCDTKLLDDNGDICLAQSCLSEEAESIVQPMFKGVAERGMRRALRRML